MEVQGVMPHGQGDIVVPGGAHRPNVPHLLHRLEHRQHPGDASLGGGLIDDVRLGHPQLGQGLFQVVEHDGHRPFLGDVPGAALPGERVDIGQRWLRLHRRHHGNGRLGLRWLWLLRRLGGTGRQAHRQGQGQQGGQGLSVQHGTFPPHLFWVFLSSIIGAFPPLRKGKPSLFECPHTLCPAARRRSFQPPPRQAEISFRVSNRAGIRLRTRSSVMRDTGAEMDRA